MYYTNHLQVTQLNVTDKQLWEVAVGKNDMISEQNFSDKRNSVQREKRKKAANLCGKYQSLTNQDVSIRAKTIQTGRPEKYIRGMHGEQIIQEDCKENLQPNPNYEEEHSSDEIILTCREDDCIYCHG